jgi:hypothetical protein
MSVPRANSTSMEPEPSRDSDWMRSTPRTCCTAASTGEVSSASVTSGDAPGHCTAMRNRGSCVSGSSSTGTYSHDTTPITATAV